MAAKYAPTSDWIDKEREAALSTDVCSDSGYAGSEATNNIAPPGSARTRVSIAGQHLTNSHAQLKYNLDRHEISRSISEAQQVATAFQNQTKCHEWPMRVPFLAEDPSHPHKPLLGRSASSLSVQDPVDTSISRHTLQRSQTAISTRLDDIDRSPKQNAAELQVLRPELLMAAHDRDIFHTMNTRAISDIMEQQFGKVKQHLRSLQVRVNDTSSKVLVTGDLNAGKSTLCNALLRQQLLPTDQQPCTEVFCEILDARENGNHTQVHAVKSGSEYSIEDNSTYETMHFSALSSVVLEPQSYSALKIYVDDQRSIGDSLLRNGVVDISLIDGPGLNADSLQTTAVYSRQEEIDVVVFVVSAENHFTLSAKQFLWTASNEKTHIFIVVNKFDTIRDKDRCRRVILEQISKLSPQTFAEADELVHFVSAEGNLNEDASFAQLELHLRNFVLERRAQSKLAPARTFIQKFWSDGKSIAEHNISQANSEMKRIQSELQSISRKLGSTAKDYRSAIDQVVHLSETTCDAIYAASKESISSASKAFNSIQPTYGYRGLLDCYTYAQKLRDQYLHVVLTSTIDAEMTCRKRTSQAVDEIRSIGHRHLNEEQYKLRPFNVNLMFSRKRDAIQRNLPVELQLRDFIDLSKLEALVGTTSLSAAIVLYGGKTLGWSAIVDSGLRILQAAGIERSPRLIALSAAVGLSATGLYLTLQVPTALQQNLSRKIREEMKKSEYVEKNALRISNECRKVLQTPEQELRTSFTVLVEADTRSKLELENAQAITSKTLNFFQQHLTTIVREHARLTSMTL